VQVPLHQAAQAKSQHAVEGVDPDLLVSPVVDGAKPQELGIFHLFEAVFNMVLRSVCRHDPFICPVVVVRKKNRLAQAPEFKTPGRILEEFPGFSKNICK
jgi:hypothetical protein